MRTYLKNMKHITSLMAFIAALLVAMSFATVSNAVVVVNPGLGVRAAFVNPAIRPPINSAAFVRPGIAPFGVGVRPFGLGVNPFFRPAFNPFFRPFGFGINPFFDADFDAVGFGFGVGIGD